MPNRVFPQGMPLSKRLFDLIASFVVLIILSPLLVVVVVMVRVIHGRPVVFRHQRPGYKGKPFIIYKFRTMTDARDDNGVLLPDKNRLTRFGKFLRAMSIDELPELFNVFRGEMSIVGPRPLLMEYLERYSQEQARRHDVFPGITGWAQVRGRNIISWEEKFKYDVWYVDHWSFGLDMKILGMTILKVIRREGINQPGFATAEVFKPEKNNNSQSEIE